MKMPFPDSFCVYRNVGRPIDESLAFSSPMIRGYDRQRRGGTTPSKRTKMRSSDGLRGGTGSGLALWVLTDARTGELGDVGEGFTDDEFTAFFRPSTVLVRLMIALFCDSTFVVSSFTGVDTDRETIAPSASPVSPARGKVW